MDADNQAGHAVAGIAGAIGEPARAKMLYSLMDGRARTSTELSVIADISPSTASVHLGRLLDARLVTVASQGKHRYYTVASAEVATVLESLIVIAGRSATEFVPSTPRRLRTSRTCYDHMAGALAVALHERFQALDWLRPCGHNNFELTQSGEEAFLGLGIGVDGLSKQRRRLACTCLDWSERKPHLGGALGAALLKCMLQRRWVVRELESRALCVTAVGARELAARFGLQLKAGGVDFKTAPSRADRVDAAAGYD